MDNTLINLRYLSVPSMVKSTQTVLTAAIIYTHTLYIENCSLLCLNYIYTHRITIIAVKYLLPNLM